jgi:Fe2+ transport system protein B
MSLLTSKVNELGDVQKSKDSLDMWIQNQENSVAEMLKRPAKFRPEAAQAEQVVINDLRQTIIEKQALLDDIEDRLRSIGSPEDHQLRIALDTLDEHVSEHFYNIVSYNVLMVIHFRL